MLDSLRIDPSDAVPIWRQIEVGVRRLIAVDSIPAGRPVPSVRDLARSLRVNPATVAKAYQRLSDAGVLTVRRGEGTFVADGAPGLSDRERARLLGEAAETYVGVARTFGAGPDEAARAVGPAWERLFGDSRSGEGS